MDVNNKKTDISFEVNTVGRIEFRSTEALIIFLNFAIRAAAISTNCVAIIAIVLIKLSVPAYLQALCSAEGIAVFAPTRAVIHDKPIDRIAEDTNCLVAYDLRSSTPEDIDTQVRDQVIARSARTGSSTQHKVHIITALRTNDRRNSLCASVDSRTATINRPAYNASDAVEIVCTCLADTVAKRANIGYVVGVISVGTDKIAGIVTRKKVVVGQTFFTVKRFQSRISSVGNNDS